MRNRWKKLSALLLAGVVLAGCGNTTPAQTGATTEQTGATTEQTTDAEATQSAAAEADTTEADATETNDATEAVEEETEETVVRKEREPIEHPQLKAVGKVLKNNSGEGDIVQLKGTNAGGYLLQEFWMTPTLATSGVSDETDVYAMLTERFGQEKMEELVSIYQDNYWTEADFDYCEEIGINCIRLPFWYKNLVGEDGQLKEDWYERFDWFIQEASERNIYTILDCHGAPGSQNGSDHSGLDGHGNKMAASQFFFGKNAGAYQELYYQLWEIIAERYKDNPWVAGYDLLNEPYCTYRYSTNIPEEELRTHLWDIYDRAYDRIRAIDSEHVIVMGATWDPVDLPDPATYEWENVMYEYHNYLYNDYNNVSGEQVNNMKKKLDAIEIANYNVPSFLGEFAYFNNLDAWDEGVKLINDTGISWTTWTYKVIDSNINWGIRYQKDLRVDLEKDEYEEIKEAWSKVGESYENEGLVKVLEKYYYADTVSAE